MTAAAEPDPSSGSGPQRPHRRPAGRRGRHVLGPGDRHHRGAGPQRRRKDQDHRGHPRSDPPHGRGRARRRADREGGDYKIVRAGWATCPRTARSSPSSPSPRTSGWPNATPHPGASSSRSSSPTCCPASGPDGRHALRRPAADGLAGARAAERQQAPAGRRAHQGPRARRSSPRSPTRSPRRPRPSRSCSSSRTCRSSASSPTGAVVIAGGRVVHTGIALEFLDDDDLTRRLLGVSAEHPPGHR